MIYVETQAWEPDSILSSINKANTFHWANYRIEKRNLQEKILKGTE